MFPARLSIPASNGSMYDFTCDNSVKVADFRQRVMDNTDLDVQNFEVLSSDPANAEAVDNLTLGEIKSNKFRIRVNSKTYDVYPDLRSIVASNEPVTVNKKEMVKLDALSTDVSISREMILRDYYASLVATLKKSAGTGGKLTKAKLDNAFK